MPKTLTAGTRLAAATLAACAAGAFGTYATAAADTPFDNPPPTVLMCGSGLGASGFEAETRSGSEEVAPGEVAYELDDGAGAGAQVGWVNTDSWRLGAVTLTPQGDDGEPQATAATGPGTVFAAVYGTHTNAQGEQCLVLPGVNTDITVPAAPAPAPAG